MQDRVLCEMPLDVSPKPDILEQWEMEESWLVVSASTMREQFGAVLQAQPLDDDQRRLVRGCRYSRKNRLVRRMALRVVKSLEVEDASPTSAALMTLQRWMEKGSRQQGAGLRIVHLGAAQQGLMRALDADFSRLSHA
jgi:hypothetical protein